MKYQRKYNTLGSPESDMQNAISTFENLQSKVASLSPSMKAMYAPLLQQAQKAVETYKTKIFGESESETIETNEIPDILLKELELIEKEKNEVKQKPITKEIERLLSKKFRIPEENNRIITLKQLIDEGYIEEKPPRTNEFKIKGLKYYLYLKNGKYIEVPKRIYDWYTPNNN